MFGEVTPQIGQLIRPISQDRLAHGEMEQPGDEGFVRFLAFGEEFGEFACAAEILGLAAACHKRTRGIDGLAVVLIAPAADGVVTLERETQRIDDAMAAAAIDKSVPPRQ